MDCKHERIFVDRRDRMGSMGADLVFGGKCLDCGTSGTARVTGDQEADYDEIPGKDRGIYVRRPGPPE